MVLPSALAPRLQMKLVHASEEPQKSMAESKTIENRLLHFIVAIISDCKNTIFLQNEKSEPTTTRLYTELHVIAKVTSPR
jgi:hypothetical protein